MIKSIRNKFLLGLIAILLLTSFIGSVRADQKAFTAEIDPQGPVPTGLSQTFTITINNDLTNPSGNKLGSAIITIPDGFNNIKDASVITSTGKLWRLFSINNLIEVTAPKSASSISPGGKIEVTFTATTPTTSGIYTFQTVAYTSPSWAGDTFNLKSSQPSVEVKGFLVTFTVSGIEPTASTNTVLTVGAESFSWNNLPTNMWVDEGTVYTWEDIVYGSQGQRFVRTSPSAGSSTITQSGEISATYKTQWYITFDQFGIDSSATGTIVIVDSAAKNSLPYSDWYDNEYSISYTYMNTVTSNTGTSFILNNVKIDSTVIPASSSITVDSATTITGYYGASFGLSFPSGFNPGTITINSNSVADPLGLVSLGTVYSQYYTVQIENNDLTGKVTIIINYDPTGLTEDQELQLRLYMSDPVDFNNDGTVNGNDINIMQEAIKNHYTTETHPEFDINHDGQIDIVDLKIVKDYASNGLIVPSSSGGQWRLPWIDITTSIDITNNLIYGETDHFSGFGVR